MTRRVTALLSYSLLLLSLLLPISAAPTPSTLIARIPYTLFQGPGSAVVVEVPPQARDAPSPLLRRADRPSSWTARDFMSWLLARAAETAPASPTEVGYEGGRRSISKRDIFGMDNDKAIKVGTAIIIVIGVLVGLLAALPAIIGGIKECMGRRRNKL